MTKFKSKKITKSTIAVIIMAIAMVAMLAFGGTYALFTATSDAKTANITTGVVKLKNGSTFSETVTGVVPGDVVIQKDHIQLDAIDSTVDTYVGFLITFTKGGSVIDPAAVGLSLDTTGGADEWIGLQHKQVKGSGTSEYVVAYVKKAVVTPAAGENPQHNYATFSDGAFKFNTEERYSYDGSAYTSSKGGENNANTLEGVSITVTITGYSVQAKNIENVSGALDDATEALLAWKAMAPAGLLAD